MNKQTLFCAFTLIAGLAFATDSVQDDDVDTTGNITIDVPSGDTLTINGKVTGSGTITKTGDGVLILTNGANDWTGQLTLEGGKVQADAEGALSTAPMFVNKAGTAEPGAWFVLNAEGATFPNTFTRSGQHGYLLWFLKSATVTGNLQASGGCTPWLYVAEGATATFEGSVSGCSGKFYYHYGPGTLVFNGKVAMSGVGYQNNTTGRTLRYGSSENVFGGFDLYGATVYCDAANVLNGATLRNSSGSATATVDLNGFDQTVSAFLNASGKLKGTVRTPDGKPAALAITSACTCSYLLSGPLSLVVDCGSDATCSFDRVNPMTGGVTVKSGTFSVSSAASFSAVETLAVSNGARAVVETRDTAVFGDDIELTLEEGAELALSGLQLTVSKLTYKGELLPFGYYSADNCPAITSGAIYVPPAGTATVTWTGAGADTDVTTAGNWSPQLPAFDQYTLAATFADGGSVATFSRNVTFESLAFTVPEFAFTGTKTMTLLDSAVTFSETAAESRVYRFDAPWCIAGNLTMTPPSATAVYLKGPVTAPTGAASGTISFDGSNGACLWLDGVTIDQNVWEKTGGGQGALALRSVVGSTNVIEGSLTTADEGSHFVWLDSSSELTVKGGLVLKNGATFIGSGTLVVKDNPVSCNSSKDFTINASVNGDGEKLTVVLGASGGTAASVSVGDYGGNVDFRADSTFGATVSFYASSRWNGYAGVRLNGTTQTFKSFSVRRTTSGPVEVFGSGGTLKAATGNSYFTGLDAGRKLALRGDVTLENAGTGTLEIGKIDLDGTLNVALSGGSSLLKVLDGETVRLGHLWVDGVEMTPGIYRYATAPAALKARLAESTGVLKVGRPGAVIMIR